MLNYHAQSDLHSDCYEYKDLQSWVVEICFCLHSFLYDFPSFLRDSVSDDPHGSSVVKFPCPDGDIQLYNPFLHLQFKTELGLSIANVVQAFVYHDEHGRDERHVEYDLDAVFACGEEV